MFARIGWVGLLSVVTCAGTAAAKSPGVPAGPVVEGREPSPVAREYYAAEASVPLGLVPFAPVPAADPKWPLDTASLAEFVTGFRAAVLNRFTIPLGAAPTRP